VHVQQRYECHEQLAHAQCIILESRVIGTGLHEQEALEPVGVGEFHTTYFRINYAARSIESWQPINPEPIKPMMPFLMTCSTGERPSLPVPVALAFMQPNFFLRDACEIPGIRGSKRDSGVA
jgi:hypothetical protein